MTAPVLQTSPAAGADAWAKARAMGDIQFTPLNPVPTPPPTPPPQWLIRMLRWLGERIAPIGEWLGAHALLIAIVVGALLVVLAGWFIWQVVHDWPRRAKSAPPVPTWAPDLAAASALLADADRLAADGQFDAAVHLLLRRSFDDIATARPEWLTPASTAREIPAIAGLPAAARTAFAVIAREVERSRYALHPLASIDWVRARDAYAAFAVPGGR